MITLMLAVHDKESRTFRQPFSMNTKRDAVESFRQVVNDENSQFNKFPDDFDLVQVGEFCVRTGELKPMPPTVLASASSLLQKETLNKEEL